MLDPGKIKQKTKKKKRVYLFEEQMTELPWKVLFVCKITGLHKVSYAFNFVHKLYIFLGDKRYGLRDWLEELLVR